MGDLSGIKERPALLKKLEETWPNENHKRLLNNESQIWPFLGVMQPGDLVALPLKSRPLVALGEITGGYQWRPEGPYDGKNTRPVRWLAELPRDRIPQDIKYSLGAFMTVCRIQRNNAEPRLKALIAGGSDPVMPRGAASILPPNASGQVFEDPESEAAPDLEAIARDQIREFILARFKGHGLSRLVGAVLRAQGYVIRESPEGPDGGVDIVAGHGPLGFDPPRLAVQVKSQQTAVDVKVVRELQGSMKNFGAQQGLVVAWGGFNNAVVRETSRMFFEIRLWSSDDLIEAIQVHYDALPPDVQAELPLKRVWVLVPEGADQS